MKNTRKYLAAALLAALAFTTSAYASDDDQDDDDKVTFALIGDTNYSATETPKVDRVIAAINADKKVKFVIHNGDIKSGSSLCDDATIQSHFTQLNALKKPWMFTPGDNEWTDCHRPKAGKFNPIERLAFVRKVFYPQSGYSLGPDPIKLTSQSKTAGYETFVENTLWQRAGVTFAMVHVIGSNNDLDPWTGIDAADSYATPRADRSAEFVAREKANLAWLDTIFDQALKSKSAGILIAMQANPNFELPATDQQRAGFNNFLDKLTALTLAFGKPVVLTHGDSHYTRVDKPLLAATTDSGPQSVENFTRVETFGSPNVHWLRVTVDKKDANVFRVEQRVIAENKFSR
jgi:Calcineurin-like phosphoesterase